MKKQMAVFFDIDGTLLDGTDCVPESAKEAIRELRKNGHLTFICTGRSRVMIPESPILEIGFDGVIAACGMYGEYQGEVLFERLMPKELLESTLKKLDSYGGSYILEGNKYLYYSKKKESAGKLWIDRILQFLPNHLLALEDLEEEVEISKWSYTTLPEEAEIFFADFEEDYTVLRHNEHIAEFVLPGESKAEGIRRICKHLNIAHENTFAFGDSINDVEMLRFCNTGIAMGNSTQPAIDASNYVTKDLQEDGIYHACRHFALI